MLKILYIFLPIFVRNFLPDIPNPVKMAKEEFEKPNPLNAPYAPTQNTII